MPDTARTLAAMQALLADNTSRDISPQDVRDLMQSVATPVAEGGFIEPPSPAFITRGFDYFAPSLNMTVPTSAATKVVMDPVLDGNGAIYDPSGYHLTTATSRGVGSWYDTPQYGAVLLPTGVYMWSAGVRWDADTTGFRTCYLYPAQDDWDDDIDPLFGNPRYGFPFNVNTSANASGLVERWQYPCGLLFVPPSPTYGTVLCPMFVNQNSGTNRTIEYFELTITRVG